MKCICKPCTEDLFTGTCDGQRWKCMACTHAWLYKDLEDGKKEVAKKLAAIDRRENEEAWRKQAPKLGIHPDMFVKKSEREALGFYEEDRYV